MTADRIAEIRAGAESRCEGGSTVVLELLAEIDRLRRLIRGNTSANAVAMIQRANKLEAENSRLRAEAHRQRQLQWARR